ncbi:MAG TPA: RodZ domain-containing protein [Actinomycetota bacterium]|nr:RodZ domain-containing protein [Actinomycetota bacterium]
MSQHTIGQLLNDSREASRASLYQASQDTKIRVDFLEAMENDDFEFVSGGLYVRGMLRSYVRWLGLPEDRVLAEFDRIYNIKSETPLSEMISRPTDVGPKPRKPQWLIAAVSAAGLLLVFSLVGLMNSPTNVATPPVNPEAERETQTAAQPPESPEIVAQAPEEPEMEGVNLVVTVTGQKAWMEAHADGTGPPVFTGTKFSGETLTLNAEESLKIVIGDAGAVRVKVNGRDLGPPGQNGAVGTFTFTPESTNFVGG